MADRYKWITDEIVLNIIDPADLEDWEQIILSIKSGSTFIEKMKDAEHDELAVIDNQIIASLTQEETASLGKKTEIQLNIYYTGGTRGATKIFQVAYDRNLHSEVMPDEE